jgi:hypothetical protein
VKYWMTPPTGGASLMGLDTHIAPGRDVVERSGGYAGRG